MKDYKLEFSLPLEALEEKKVSSTPIFDGKVLHVRLDEITLPNGKGATREYCHHNGAVCVIPICDNGDVLCVRQFRYPFGEPLIEIPAGKLDSPDENPDSAVRRELREETGAVSNKITYLGQYYGSPAKLDERIYMYIAEEHSFGETDFDEAEFIEPLRIPLDALVQMVLEGKIRDGKTQIAALRAFMMLKQRKDAEC
ncbi:MAG: NUDIX hydrolase [Clostridia bacterium]|nr:NUDIX hydrolase [Clostridia bacterium]